MSLDIWAQADLGGAYPYELDFHWNYTSNVNPMWRKAFGEDLGDLLQGKRCGDTVEALQRGAEDMATHREDYEALNPKNGWGDWLGARQALNQLIAFAVDCPNAVWVCHQ